MKHLLTLIAAVLVFACGTPEPKLKAVTDAPVLDVARDQMLERAKELHSLGIIHRDQIPDRQRQAQEVFSSPQVGLPTYPFGLFITTPPGSSHPGTYPVPIDGGNYIHRWRVRLEYLQVGSWLEPYYVIYVDHGTGTLTVISGDTNESEFVGLPK